MLSASFAFGEATDNELLLWARLDSSANLVNAGPAW
jgi:hypothetical protein